VPPALSVDVVDPGVFVWHEIGREGGDYSSIRLVSKPNFSDDMKLTGDAHRDRSHYTR
jgi:hypothetical protein